MDNDDFSELLNRARAGDAAASADLLNRCEHHIQILVRSKLPRKIRSKFDSMDFVQAVWKSFFAKGANTPSHFEGENHFVRYLSGAASNKVNEQFRRHTKTAKFNVALEEPLYIRKGNREIPRDLAGSDPTPSQDAQAVDRLEQILEGSSELERKVLTLRRQGLTYTEIEKQTGIGEASVRRIIESFRKKEERRGWE